MKKTFTTYFSRILVGLLATHSMCTFAGAITVAEAKKRMVVQLTQAGFDQDLSNEIAYGQAWESKSNDGLIDEQDVEKATQEIITEIMGVESPVQSHAEDEGPTISLQQAIAEASFRLFSRGFNPDFDPVLLDNIVDGLTIAACSYKNSDTSHAYVLTRTKVNTIFEEEIDKFSHILKPHIAQSSPDTMHQTATTSPRIIKKQTDVDTIHVTQQRGVTCGYHAVFNARAIQELVRSGQKVTPEAVQEIAQRYHHLIDRTDYELFYHEILELAREVGLTTFHIIAYNEAIKKVYDAANSDDVPVELNEFFAKLVSEKMPIAHLLCNTGGHWVTLSIMHNEDGIPHIMYLDSMNPRSMGNIAQTYVQYIKDNLAQTSEALEPTSAIQTTTVDNNVVNNKPAMDKYRNALFGTALGLSAATLLAHKFMR